MPSTNNAIAAIEILLLQTVLRSGHVLEERRNRPVSAVNLKRKRGDVLQGKHRNYVTTFLNIQIRSNKFHWKGGYFLLRSPSCKQKSRGRRLYHQGSGICRLYLRNIYKNLYSRLGLAIPPHNLDPLQGIGLIPSTDQYYCSNE